MPRTLSFTKKQLFIGAFAVSCILASTASVGAGVAFAFCSYVVLTS